MYVGTGLKILSQIGIERLLPDIKELLGDLFVCESAHIRYLQEEYASLLVQAQYSRDTSRLFRSLQRKTSVFNPQSLEQLPYFFGYKTGFFPSKTIQKF